MSSKNFIFCVYVCIKWLQKSQKTNGKAVGLKQLLQQRKKCDRDGPLEQRQGFQILTTLC